ncbi:caspase family protein [Hassallia byssoidea VB512170]|uniref:Caspase family protein n=1 Tax=Hassallia byssoidea VB512170 TaxID=1304833 RepID=A0A846H8R4_9CYAN|nr:caspase family protein [Hassalia byssoidea]NEU73722.1 caspase family protein [Hassalia byssoidea VB512170]
MAEIKRSLAVVIGIDEYSNGIPALQTAVNDAKEIAATLKSKYEYQVLLLLDGDANSDKFNSLLTALEQHKLFLPDGSQIEIQETDRLFFYFAGHGIALDTLDNADGPAGFLVPQDAGWNNDGTWLSMTRLHDALQKLPCRHLLIILDCCFAGAFRWAGDREAVRQNIHYRERYDRFISSCAQQVITSASDDEKAVDCLYPFGQRCEHDGHSPFALVLLKALRGEVDLSQDGLLTATELFVYLQSEFYKINAKQTPNLRHLKHHDDGDYIFPIPSFDRNHLAPAPAISKNTNPYRGLKSFEEEHSQLFFGRNKLISKLAEFMIDRPLTVVLGASGSGKSSLVKAGLIPYLKLGTSHQEWRILAPVRPGESPFVALNKTLIKENLPIFAEPNKAFEQELQNLYQSVGEWYRLNPQAKFLLVIDEFEELVTVCQDETESQKFFEGLARAIKAFPEQLRIVVTLRNDFEPQFRNTPLEPYWESGRFVMPKISRQELRSCIVEPAAAKVMYFDPPSLVDEVIDEVVQMPGALPLLSFTLSELYLKYIQSVKEGKRNNRAITQSDYAELGGVTRSLTKRADFEYDELVKLDPAYSQTIKHVMLRMVAVGSSDLTRRRVLCKELEYPQAENTRVKLVISRFVAARLLVKGRDIENNEYVEPAHDALIREWQKLLNWKKQELASLVLQTELRPTANKWATQKHDKKAVGLLWYNDPRLPLVQQLLKSDIGWLNLTELEFVKRSIQKRRNKHLKAIAILSAVMILLSQLTAFGFIQLRFSIVNNSVEEIRQSSLQSTCFQLHNFSKKIPQTTEADIAEDK